MISPHDFNSYASDRLNDAIAFSSHTIGQLYKSNGKGERGVGNFLAHRRQETWVSGEDGRGGSPENPL